MFLKYMFKFSFLLCLTTIYIYFHFITYSLKFCSISEFYYRNFTVDFLLNFKVVEIKLEFEPSDLNPHQILDTLEATNQLASMDKEWHQNWLRDPRFSPQNKFIITISEFLYLQKLRSFVTYSQTSPRMSQLSNFL